MSEARAPAVVTTSAYYEGKLADPKARLPVFADEPQPGRYRARNGERWMPVAIWTEDGAVQMLRDNAPELPQRFAWLWSLCANHPISPDEYDRMLSPERASDPVYQELPDSAAALSERARALAAIPLAIETRDDANRMADVAHALKAIADKCAKTRDDAIEPLAEQVAAIKREWVDPIALAEMARAAVMDALARFLERSNMPGGAKGQLGKAISLRTDQALEITSYADALAHFVALQPEAFSGVVDKLARAALKAGKAVPGAKMTEKRRAQ